MSLDRLWAGWRTAYVSGSGGDPHDRGSASPERSADDPGQCVFCRIAASGPPSAANGVLWSGQSVLVVLNAFPYASGHLMAVPVRHVGSLGDLADDEAAELWSAARAGVAALEAAYAPEGINLGANLGEAAGAGIPRHLHLHAVPRWRGDTNFMTAVADTRVLPETLASSWERLTAAWPADRPADGGA
ncbi:MAG TPA: HIT domain-containing protein [Acidimicrobiales bacterium]|nr:HIT domain-containing protein [Acidimicrobiales bacterium]